MKRPDHQPEFTGDQEAASEDLVQALTADGLAAPLVEELPETLRSRSDFWSMLRRLESLGTVRQVADGYYVDSQTLTEVLPGSAIRLPDGPGLARRTFETRYPSRGST